jgi:hypothetical protein
MTRITSGIALGMLLALAGIAEAKSVSIDFTGDSPVSQGLTQVNKEADKDGDTTIAQRGGKNVAATGNTDQSRYLYLAIDPAFKQDLKTAWVTVEYFDEGTGGFKVEYDSQDDPHTAATLGDTTARTKHDTKTFTRQTWHLTNIKLAGGQEGGADLRINDRAGDDPDGAEYIAKVTVSDEDPDFVRFPYAVNKITIDGVANPAEWDGAHIVTLDRAQFGAESNWTGPEDFSGTYSFKWDEEALYIRGQVVDATPRLNTAEGGHYWNGDGMEQFLGLDDSDTEITNGFTETDFKVMIGLGQTPKWSVDRRDGNDPTDFGDMKANIGIANTSDPVGYNFEARIPWSVLNNATVTPGQRIRWHMYANNSKVDPSEQQVAMTPSGRGDLNHKLSLWYRAVLEPKPAQ